MNTTTTEEEEEEQIECAECGTTYNPDDGGGLIDGIGECCGHCYYDAGTECQLCGERYGDQDKYWSGLIVANHEFVREGGLWVPGLYLAKGSPYTGAMIGSGTVNSDNLLYAGWDPTKQLPDLSGYVCRGCGSAHSRAARLYYGNNRKSWRGEGPAYALEAHWMRTTLAAQPGLLRGHECEPSGLDELWQRLDIAPMPTWNEWLQVEHRGVRVWRQHQWNDWKYCVLRPEPRYREDRINLAEKDEYPNRWERNTSTFHVTDLATHHPGDWHGNHGSSVDRHEAEEAIRAAIDRGILTQQGIVPEKNVVDWGERGRVLRQRYEALDRYWRRPAERGYPDLTTADKAWEHLCDPYSYGFGLPNRDESPDAADKWALIRAGWDSVPARTNFDD